MSGQSPVSSNSGGGSPVPEMSSKETCLRVLKGIALPIIMIAGPIIALAGIVISALSHLVKEAKNKSLQNYKTQEKNRLLKEGGDVQTQVNALDSEISELNAMSQQSRIQLTADCKKWGRRMVPLLYGIDVLNEIACEEPCRITSSQASSDDGSVSSDPMEGPSGVQVPRPEVSSPQAPVTPPVIPPGMVKEVGNFIVPLPATQKPAFDGRGINLSPPRKPCDNKASGVPEDNRFLQEMLATRWGIERDDGKSLTLLNINSGMRLTMVQNDISVPYDTSSIGGSGPLAIVNAANSMMSRGGAGTNRALTNVTTDRCWNAGKENQAQLKPGEAVAGFWESSPSGPTGNQIPRVLIQALGPNLASANSDAALTAAIPEIRDAFLSAFDKADKMGCSHVQTAMLSDQNFAPQAEPYRSKWLISNKLAFLEAIRQSEDATILNHIILVNYSSEPDLAGWARDFCGQIQRNP